VNTADVQIAVDGEVVGLEVALIGSGPRLIVFLHEGLGSLGGWSDWPRALCAAAKCRGLVYSRYGYGHSSIRPPGTPWPHDYLDIEARAYLPALLRALGIDALRDPPILFGHSDGATIALQYAAAFPDAAAAVIVLAPHLFVEPVARARIAQLRDRWNDGRLRARLAQLHDDPDGVFMGWSGCWLDPAFAHWHISATLGSIACPALAIQGTLDQYGTLEQLDDLQRNVPHAELLALEGCHHVPHEEQPDAVREAVVQWLGGLDNG
jgi:pimeloyl-ACP methyl ester carboxylesterase